MAESEKPLKAISNRMSALSGKNGQGDLSFGKVQPQAIALEEAVLGAIMLDKDAFPTATEILRSESFYLESHQLIYNTMSEIYGQSQPIDLLTVHEALKKAGALEKVGGITYLMELTNKIASSANLEFHARIIAQKYIQRELIRVSTLIIEDSYDETKDVFELLDMAEQSLYDITDKNLSSGYESLKMLAIQAQREIEAASQKGSEMTGVTTGYVELDKLTSGWQPSDLIIIAARPGMGKTAFTLSLAKNAAEAGRGVAVFSLEMASVQLVQRLISMEAEISGSKLRNGQMEDYEWKKLHEAVEKLADVPIFIDDTPGINIFELRAKCRRLKQKHDISMIVIDYLQLMSGAPGGNGGGNREQEISTISRALKGLAKELSVPVIALSQLSRAVESRGGEKRPMLSDLRESGAIEQDADIVTFIYRPGYYGIEEGDMGVPSDLTEIIVAKHRNGSLDTVELKFVGQYVKFEDPGEGGFSNDLGGSFVADPFANGMVTRQSKMNDGNEAGGDSSAGFGTPDLGDIPF
jgi:replicative DNA helicase